MARVAQIVAQQQVIGVDVQCIAIGNAPAILVILGQIVNVVSVGQRRIAHPDPDHPHVLVNRVLADFTVWWGILGRCADTGAVAIEDQSMITALKIVPGDPAF